MARDSGRAGGADDLDEADERVARRLTAPGPSRLSIDGALRARDVSRPSTEDLAAAERALRVQRARTT